MPTVKVRLAVLVRSLGDELLLAEAMLFPEAACLHRQTAQVRRMLAAVDCDVDRLRRVRIGSLRLGELALGQFRRLHQREVDTLRQSVGLEA